MYDLLVQMLREGNIYHSALLSLTEGQTKIFGRATDDDEKAGVIPLRSSEASRRHFQIAFRSNGYWLEDCGSTNGTFVNGAKLAGPKPLGASGWLVQPGPTSKVAVKVMLLSPKLAADETATDESQLSYCADNTKQLGAVDSVPMIGGSWSTQNRELQQIFAIARKIAPTAFPILLEGERGTGKGTLAQAIHLMSGRKEFIYLNAGRLNSEVGWDSLVGHVKGAFTSAYQTLKGLLARNDATLFFDEIDALTPAVQIDLLSVLNDAAGGKVEFRKTGSTQMEAADIRIIAACAVSRAKQLKPELLDRIAMIHLLIPPLRVRIKDDFDFLATMVCHHIAEQHHWDIVLTPEAKDKLLSYDYPGNVRDLKRILVNARLASSSMKISVQDVAQAIASLQALGDNDFTDWDHLLQQGNLDQIERYCIAYHAKAGKTKTEAARLLYGDKGNNTTKLLNRRLQEYGFVDLWPKDDN